MPFPSALGVVVDAGDVGVEVEVDIIIIMEVIDIYVLCCVVSCYHSTTIESR